jgi:mannose-6-phosphate isomerase-like protein (cupin superfamily)
MPTLVVPSRVPVDGDKFIEEYVGRHNTGDTSVSIARMRTLEGWTEVGQKPEFDEYTLVIKGTLSVEFEGGSIDVQAGQAVVAKKGEWVRYSTPHPGGAVYLAICVPAFEAELANRDAE